MKTVEDILGLLQSVHRQGSGWMACCPAHDDHTPSLSISEGDDGKVLMKCFAGCDFEKVVSALGLTIADLMPYSSHSAALQKSVIVATYDYQDEVGTMLFQVVRYQPKSFRQRQPDGKGGWKWSVKDVRSVPFHLPRLLTSQGDVVFFVEGEKDVIALEGIGCIATCNAGGASKWTAEHSVYLTHRDVVVLPDNDVPGGKHAETVAMSLQGIARTVKVVTLPGLGEKGDVSDWIAAGGTKEQLVNLADATRIWKLGSQAWPNIESLDYLQLPLFPVEVLPRGLQEFVEAESHATQTPSDLAAIMSLATCAAAIARKVRIEARPGFSEPTNLFVCVILDPGNRKSAVFADVIRPLKDLENELIEETTQTVAMLTSRRRQDEKRLQDLEKKGAHDVEARRDAEELAAELAQQPIPVAPRLIVEDATGEKLGMMLADQGGRIASFSAEGTVFDLMAGLYSKSGLPQMDVYLKGHNGDDLVTDRVGRETVRVTKPALTCAYTVQEIVLKAMSKNKAFRGRGLLGRFLYAIPESWIGHRQVACPPVPESVNDTYDQLIRRLFTIDGPVTLRLSREAAVAFESWEVEAEAMLADGGPLEGMHDWGAKLHGATLRLAGILHCVAGSPHEEVSICWVEAAITISRYLIPHAQTVFDSMTALSDPVTDGARYIVRWIEKNRLQEFSRRDAHQHGRRKFKKAEDIDAPLNELIGRGYIREQPINSESQSTPGRKPSRRYQVNPVLLQREAFASCPQYPQNAVSPPNLAHFEDSEDASLQTRALETGQVA
ncbi:DUF3987 domain-containing protein [Blastopirellula marina]|uniref:DNA primase domain protein n=1 Tax=Blastopirellula marina DSM 3645 TaxID=314230 RepID=A3ZXD6_9BACT|nr:YfjI family protein [Blastopirellula marina]EAQ78790.1 DNA primase domain protein [Blastopirellula marina DSM 3645]